MKNLSPTTTLRFQPLVDYHTAELYAVRHVACAAAATVLPGVWARSLILMAAAEPEQLNNTQTFSAINIFTTVAPKGLFNTSNFRIMMHS